MKLSDKGWHKLVVAENLLDDPDFEQSDFEGAVVLSIKEAKKISAFFDDVMVCDFPIKLSDEDQILWVMLDKRIEQAEKGNAS